MTATFKVWHCEYRWSGRFQTFQDYDCIVIAEIKDKALGMALTAYPDSNPQDWSASEIPMDREGVHKISEHGT